MTIICFFKNCVWYIIMKYEIMISEFRTIHDNNDSEYVTIEDYLLYLKYLSIILLKLFYNINKEN